jgi:hypothetical protein
MGPDLMECVVNGSVFGTSFYATKRECRRSSVGAHVTKACIDDVAYAVDME